MKNIQTRFLKLTKPIVGTTNWGAVINQNYDKIDNGMATMQSSIQTIEGRLNEVGTFSFLRAYNQSTWTEIDFVVFDSVYIKDSKGNYYTVSLELESNEYKWKATQIADKLPTNSEEYGTMRLGYVNSQNQFVNKTGQYTFLYHNSNSTQGDGTAKISMLPDFIAFYIFIPTVTYKDSDDSTLNVQSIYAFGQEWFQGDILIKSSMMVDNTRTSLIMRFKQSLGGYYEPRININRPHDIIFTKKPSMSAIVEKTLTIPCYVENSKETVDDVDVANSEFKYNTELTRYMEYNTGSGTINIQQTISNIRFFTQNGTVKTYVYLPYRLSFENNYYYIIVDVSKVPKNFAKIKLSYVTYATAEPIGAGENS